VSVCPFWVKKLTTLRVNFFIYDVCKGSLFDFLIYSRIKLKPLHIHICFICDTTHTYVIWLVQVFSNVTYTQFRTQLRSSWRICIVRHAYTFITTWRINLVWIDLVCACVCVCLCVFVYVCVCVCVCVWIDLVSSCILRR